MLSDCKVLDDYLLEYGELLGQKAVAATLPLFIAGEDEAPVDLSFVSLAEPHIVPYACQANVIYGVVLAWLRQRCMLICGEMGTGKTLLGAAAIHAHATRVGKTGYRAMIVCPNHLIGKWEEEILQYIPGAKCFKFEKSDPNKADDSYREVAAFIWERKGGAGKWKPAGCPEFAIVGSNQAKQEPGVYGLGEREFEHEPGVAFTRHVGEETVLDQDGKPVMSYGKPLTRPINRKVPCCPKCGETVLSGKHVASFETLWQKQLSCTSKYLAEVAVVGSKRQGCDRISPVPPEFETRKAGDVVTHLKRAWVVRECGENLWEWAPKPRKWAPAKLFHKQGRKMFDYVVLDEMHEAKGDAGTARANAAGKLLTTGRKILGLTGTLIGGYAHHLFPLLFRMAPASLVAEGFKWGEQKPFVNLYGTIETTVTVTIGGETKKKKGTRNRGTVSMRKDYDGDQKEREEIKPGVMPTFFGRHLMDKTVFISLDEMYDDLPVLIDDDRSLVACDMDPELKTEFGRIQEELVDANNDLLQKGSTRLLSAMLHTLLEYPDKPYGWTGPYDDADAVGYFKDSDDKCRNTWVGVVQPADLDASVVYSKEQALYDLCMKEANEGRQVWVYCTQTGKRDVQGRLKGILESGGLKAKIMRSSQVDTYSRREWIAEHGPQNHVIISHPELVSTGLDFFCKQKTFNFCTIVFYEGDYRVNLIRQSGRRHWRIGQTKECRTFYMYYQGTMQERQIEHVGRKYAAAKSLEGKFSAEGLAAMSDGGSPMTQMAKALSTKIEDPRKSWGKLRDDQKAKLIKMQRDGSLTLLADAAKADPRMKVLAETLCDLDDDFIEPFDLALNADALDLLDDPELDNILANLMKIAS